MSKMRVILVLGMVMQLLAACHPASDNPADKPARELLHAVPSDAIAVMCFEDCSKGLASVLDTSNLLLKLDLGKLRHSRAILAYEYVGSVSPVLLIETKTGAEENELLADQAQALGMMVVILNPNSVAGHHSAMMIANSTAVMSSVAKHIGSDTSILDAPGFMDALTAAGSQKEIAFVRHSSIDKLMPKGFLEDFQPRKDLTAFLHNAADWTVISMKDLSHTAISLVSDGNISHFPCLAAELKDGECKLPKVLPSGFEYAMTLPIESVEDFREAYERHLDANVRLDRYNDRMTALRKETGKSPLDWEKENKVREVALLIVGGERIQLVRMGREPDFKECCANPYRGFVQALYGQAFASEADSCRTAIGKWVALGPAEAISSLGDKDALAGIKLPSKADYVVLSRNATLKSGSKGIELDVQRPE